MSDNEGGISPHDVADRFRGDNPAATAAEAQQRRREAEREKDRLRENDPIGIPLNEKTAN